MSFHCQRCNNPLSLDHLLTDINPVQVNLLGRGHPNQQPELDNSQFISPEKISLYNEISADKAPLITRNDTDDSNPVTVLTSFNLNSFVMLNEVDEDVKTTDVHKNGTSDDTVGASDESVEASDGPISSRVKLLEKIFEILSLNGEIDHPLCQECLNLIISNYKLKFDQSQKEKDYYFSFLKKLRDQGDIQTSETEIDSKLAKAIEEYRNLQNLEISRLNELKQLENAKEQLDMQYHQLETELRHLQDNDLEEVLGIRNGLSLELNTGVEKLNQAKCQYQTHLDHLDKLRNLNIYSEFFNISSDLVYGTINGFRLGYKIPWSEINAALGQVILVFVFLIKRLNFKLTGFKLIPMGSQSQIIKFIESPEPKKLVLNVYSSNEFSLGKLFNFNKFDISMIALLEVLLQIQVKVNELDSELEFPYKISSKFDTIGGKSIRVTSNAEWTDGCKFMLTNITWLVKYTSVHTRPSGD